MNTTPDEIAELIARLEQRAADGEEFARLALPGWRAELKSLQKGGDDLTPETPDEQRRIIQEKTS